VRGVLLALFVLTVFVASAHAQETKPVILVSDNPADLAVAQLLAQKLNATIVTTPWGTLSEEAVRKIKVSGATVVYVVGGPVAVPDVEVKIEVKVKRIAGKDRYETAAIAASMWNETDEAVVVEGTDELGIREALEKARARGVPILLVKGDEVPEGVEKAIEKLRAKRLHVIPAPDMNITKIEKRFREYGVREVNSTHVDFAERAAEALEDAREAIAEADFNTSNVTSGWELAAARLLLNAKEHLKQAEDAYNESKYGRAFGLAVAAKHEAKAAKRILEHVAPGYFRRHVEEAEKEIEEHGLEKAREELERAKERMEKAREKMEKARERREEFGEKVEERARAGRQEDNESQTLENEHMEYMNTTNATGEQEGIQEGMMGGR